MAKYNISKLFNKYDKIIINKDYLKLNRSTGFSEKEIQIDNITAISLDDYHVFGRLTTIIMNLFAVAFLLLLYELKNLASHPTVSFDYMFIIDPLMVLLVFFIIGSAFSYWFFGVIIIETGSSKDKLISRKRNAKNIVNSLKSVQK